MTVLTLVLKILTLILVDSCFEFHMFFNCRNVVLAFPILAFMSASGPPCLSMMLPPVALLELLPVSTPGKGGGLGMALASPSRRKLTH
ncbi:unnamed protein product [Schistosoma margrebowiei]|uniref:Uncharacterized protein n=1 Tax=Schistosoma margrebowiei TaxID=48269 RepID=A0A3P8BRI8_9TREM|nr:unnamed protein product [Schistosoma margrebowiei]